MRPVLILLLLAFLLGLLLGFACGFGVRAWISRRRLYRQRKDFFSEGVGDLHPPDQIAAGAQRMLPF
jgi:hypothetical protein